MTITIMHLYYDLFNLYGENGNVKAMQNYLNQMNIDVKIKFVTLNDEISLDDVDILYIGSTTEENQVVAIPHIMKYQKQIKKYFDDGGYILSTGNSIELFGNFIIKNNKKIKTLKLLNFDTKIEDFRLVDEALFSCDLISNKILGFINRNSVMKNVQCNSLFQVIKGIGYFPKEIKEGIHEKNFYGTYLIGPILIRNPKFLEYLMNEIILKKYPSFEIPKVDLSLEESAYEEFMKNYYSEL